MKKILFFCTLFLSFIMCGNAKTFTIEETLKSSDPPLNSFTYNTEGPSMVYDFFDENGNFNSVYRSENTIYWSTFDSNLNMIKTRSWATLYDNSGLNAGQEIFFYGTGGAIYEDGYLYVLYQKPSYGTTSTERYTSNVLAVGKYDTNGDLVLLKEYQGQYLNANGMVGATGYGMDILYYTASSSMTIQNGVLTLFFGGNMYNGHQSSLIMYINTETLEHMSRIQDASLNTDYRHMYFTTASHSISHSLGQRIIKTSDGGYLLMEVGDAGATRGLMLSKIYLDHYTSDDDDFDYLNIATKRVVHFTEGGASSHGYNMTNQALGSLIEVDDGYLYIGAMDKVLSAAYGSAMNHPWDIFVQKYTKDFYTLENAEDMQMLDTEPRIVTGEKSEYNGVGRLYLTGDEVDYGMKWLTSLEDETIILIRASKLSDGNIIIVWEQEQTSNNSDEGIYPSGKTTTYYMVIDQDANVVKEATAIENVSLNNEEHYVEKNGFLYWTTTSGKTLSINKLNIYNAIESIEVNTTHVELEYTDTYQLQTTITPSDTTMDKTLTYISSNPSVATVSDTGLITAKYPGKTTITVTTKNNISKSIEVTVTGDVPYIKGDMNFDGEIQIIDFILGLRYFIGTYAKTEDLLYVYDMNENGKLEMIDAILILRRFLNTY